MLLTLFNTERYEEHYRTGFWRDDTIYSLVRENAQCAPDRIAVRSAHGDFTYKELLTPPIRSRPISRTRA